MELFDSFSVLVSQPYYVSFRFFFSLFLFVSSFFCVFFSLTFTDTFFTLDVYLGHGDAVRVVDPELGKLERENLGQELPPHGISLNTPILGTTSTSTRRHTRRESNPGMMNIHECANVFDMLINDVSFHVFSLSCCAFRFSDACLCASPRQQMQKKMIL